MTEEDMERLTADTEVKSEKIRILFREGVERADIARFMGVQYSYVQNILKRSGLLQAAPSGHQVSTKPASVYTCRVEAGGKISLPSQFLEEYRIGEGDTLICHDGEAGLVIMSRRDAAEWLRKIARERMPGEAALIDALLGDPSGSP